VKYQSLDKVLYHSAAGNMVVGKSKEGEEGGRD
jgi:hypothetical protein